MANHSFLLTPILAFLRAYPLPLVVSPLWDLFQPATHLALDVLDFGAVEVVAVIVTELLIPPLDWILTSIALAYGAAEISGTFGHYSGSVDALKYLDTHPSGTSSKSS
jgi:hypothetical protein